MHFTLMQGTDVGGVELWKAPTGLALLTPGAGAWRGRLSLPLRLLLPALLL